MDWFPLRHRLAVYTKAGAQDDIRAGTNVALMAFPQCMAYALIAGLPIQYGLFCFVGASLIGPLFGGSRFNSYGPSNATAVLVLSTFLALGISGKEVLVALPILVLLAGIFLILGAFANVARLIQYISRTVITGYITAAALLIIANQIKNVLGFDIEKSPSFFGVIWNTGSHIAETHWPSLLLACATGGAYALLGRHFSKLPNVAIVLVLAALAAFGLNHAGWEVRTLDALVLGEWRFADLKPDFNLVSQLATPALALAFLITLEANSIGKSLAARSGDRLNPNQEMFGLGMANLSSALFGGMAASASLTRSTLNFKSGAFSSLTNFWAALLVAGLLVGLSPLIQFIPVPALAVIVISIGISLISRHQILIVSKSTRSDAIVFGVTLTAGLLLALDTAIYLGAAVAIILFLRKVAEPELVEYSFNDEGQLTELGEAMIRPNPEVSIVHVEGELFFGAAELFYTQVRRVVEDPNLKVLILKLRNAHRLDATAVFALEELADHMRENQRHLLISEARKDAIRIFKNSGLLERVGRENIFPDNPQNTTLSTAKALKRALSLLEGKNARVSIYVDAAKQAESDS